jgi:hypothetical protein
MHPFRKAVLIAATMATMSVAALVSAYSGSLPASTSRTTAPSSSSSTPTAGARKPPLIGLVTMGDMNWSFNPKSQPLNRLLEANAHPGVYTAAVTQATWSQLGPQPGVFDDNVINRALQNIAAYNARHPSTPHPVGR